MRHREFARACLCVPNLRSRCYPIDKHAQGIRGDTCFISDSSLMMTLVSLLNYLYLALAGKIGYVWDQNFRASRFFSPTRWRQPPGGSREGAYRLHSNAHSLILTIWLKKGENFNQPGRNSFSIFFLTRAIDDSTDPGLPHVGNCIWQLLPLAVHSRPTQEKVPRVKAFYLSRR